MDNKKPIALVFASLGRIIIEGDKTGTMASMT